MGDTRLAAFAWEPMHCAAYGILLLPLLSFLINGLWLGRKSARASAWTATVLMGATAALSIIVASGYRDHILTAPHLFPARAALAFEHTWLDFSLGSGAVLSARLGFYLDPISVMMVLVISFISFLVNLYSIGYMKDDAGAGRFFPLLSFFSFTMLGLVVSSNLAQTFFFWELVGAASYLLIGFWYAKPSAVAASKKAFILTRLADAFFLMGLLAVGVNAGSFDFAHLNGPEAAAALNHSVGAGLVTFNLLSLGTLGIYMGAWGKSAMFPFHVWLPDAMEGPTPVSSLIHSATMVVAGVYLTARLYPLFSAAEYTLRVVECTGAFTAVFAAAIACAQTDLKRILAFSTLSQLGLMMSALGTGGGGEPGAAYTASMFHIFTHAFFKCLLFLSAGAVIHAIHSNDIREAGAGGLRKAMPRTYWATLIAVAAIAGIWPLSGFFSKEAILHAALANGRYGALAAGLCTGALTAFYMARYFFLIFHGSAVGSRAPHDSRATHAQEAHPVREGALMTLPILILAVPSALIGILGKGFFTGTVRLWGAEGGASAGVSESALPMRHASSGSWLPAVATVLALSGAGIAWYWYAFRKNGAAFPDRRAPAWYRILAEKFYIDEIYLFLAKRVASKWIAAPAEWTERNIVNGAFDWMTGAVKRLAFLQSIAQSGQVQAYIAVALLGIYLLFRFTGPGY